MNFSHLHRFRLPITFKTAASDRAAFQQVRIPSDMKGMDGKSVRLNSRLEPADYMGNPIYAATTGRWLDTGVPVPAERVFRPIETMVPEDKSVITDGTAQKHWVRPG